MGNERQRKRDFNSLILFFSLEIVAGTCDRIISIEMRGTLMITTISNNNIHSSSSSMAILITESEFKR